MIKDFLSKNKLAGYLQIPYLIWLFIVFSFIIPINSFALSEDSIYVWSTNSSSIPTSTSPSNNQENASNPSPDISR